MDVYDPSQYPNAQWEGTAAGAPFDIQPSQYGGGYAATDPAYLTRASSLHRGRSRHRYQQGYDNAGYIDQGYNDMGHQAYADPYGAMGTPGVNPPQYSQYVDDFPPLEEYYGPPPPRPLSRRSSRSRGRYLGQNYQQNYDYDPYYNPDYNRSRHHSKRRRHRSLDYNDDRSYRSYDDRSYDDRSYYSDDYHRPHHQNYAYDYYNQPYSNGYSYNGQPTVVYASQTHPTVVPINGGSGGYVVVPAAGQQVRVVDNRSFFEKLFSPSSWNLGDNRYAVRKRKGYQFFY
ncbi:hypothetical protein CVT26_001949 [Gymnopilus dilepis]|uniref:Uncharacterized protein n=1 Tax=Gymnopilus dilepis TaxID=231916 RepID=A0A409WE28_9AGAR|nr:hypothetical protein CVT26_001949 [Gymnopilus dilepis]